MENDHILLGRGRELLPLPRRQFEQHLAAVPEHHRQRLAFMSEAHHRVRYFVVSELSRRGQPISNSTIAQALRLAPAEVDVILTELERHLFFLVRNAAGDVSWAFPVTSDETPHWVVFGSGEAIYAA